MSEKDKIGDIMRNPPSGLIRMADGAVTDPVALICLRAADGADGAATDRDKAVAFRNLNQQHMTLFRCLTRPSLE